MNLGTIRPVPPPYKWQERLAMTPCWAWVALGLVVFVVVKR